MSWRATAWVNQVRGITRSEKLLMFVLSDRYNEDEGCARPSIPTIAEEALMSSRTASRTISSLQKKGLLEVIERAGRVSLYKFPTQDNLTLSRKIRDDKKDLHLSNTHDKSLSEPMTPGCHTNRKENRLDDKPLDDAQQIDTTQSILPWLKRKWEEHQATLSKSLRKKFNPGPYPEQFERQEESFGKIEYRKLFLQYLSEFNQGMIDFAKRAAPYCSGGRPKTNLREWNVGLRSPLTETEDDRFARMEKEIWG